MNEDWETLVVGDLYGLQRDAQGNIHITPLGEAGT
jgi:hypothetical protein